MSRRRLVFLLFAAAMVAVFFVPTFIGLLADWWWFQEIGYQIVFTRELITRVLIFLVGGGLTFAVLYLNLRVVQRGLVPSPILLQLAPSAPHLNLPAAMSRLSLPVSLGLALLTGLGLTPAWELVLRVLYRTPFGIADPIFGRDIGFY